MYGLPSDSLQGGQQTQRGNNSVSQQLQGGSGMNLNLNSTTRSLGLGGGNSTFGSYDGLSRKYERLYV